MCSQGSASKQYISSGDPAGGREERGRGEAQGRGARGRGAARWPARWRYRQVALALFGVVGLAAWAGGAAAEVAVGGFDPSAARLDGGLDDREGWVLFDALLAADRWLVESQRAPRVGQGFSLGCHLTECACLSVQLDEAKDLARRWKELSLRPAFAAVAGVRQQQWSAAVAALTPTQRACAVAVRKRQADWEELKWKLALGHYPTEAKLEAAETFLAAHGDGSYNPYSCRARSFLARSHSESVPPPKAPLGFVFVPSAGRCFEMSSPGEGSGWRPDRDEVPHEVVFSRSLFLKETEVTQGEWDAFVDWWNAQDGRGGAVNPSHFEGCGPRCPVERVNWFEAVAYVNYLSSVEGLAPCYALQGCAGAPGTGMRCREVELSGLDCLGYRLPTEAEWEFAARGGEPQGGYPYALTVRGVNHAVELTGLALYGGNSGVRYEGADDCGGWREKAEKATRCGPQPVRSRGPMGRNAFGLYDMLGSVWEWVHDAYTPDLGSSRALDPVHEDAKARVVRGCSWGSNAQDCRAARRQAWWPCFWSDRVGFRPARTAP